jgi:hypothetical protein
MGISKRKVGSVVRCPTCSGQVVVPDTDVNEDNPDDLRPGPALFERSDFDDILRPGAQAPAATTPGVAGLPVPPPPGAWGTHAEPVVGVERLNPSGSSPALRVPDRPAGGKITLIVVLGILLLGAAFAAGVVVGKFVLS